MRWVALGLCALAGCATAGGRFPTVDELQRLAERPPPEKLTRGLVRNVESWALAGPLPTTAEETPHAPATPWDRLLAESPAARRGLLFASEPMTCAARELGRFFLAERAMPDERLERFIAARCGNSLSQLATTHWAAELPDSVPEDKAFDQWRPDVERGLAEELRGGQRAAGIWFGRKDGRAVVMVAHNLRRAVLDRTPLVPGPDGKVRLRGELLVPAAKVEASINRGRFGYAHCEVDAAALPRFAVECATEPSDESAWLEVAAFPAGRILGPMVLNLLVWPSSTVRDAYQRASALPPRAQAGDLTAEILQMVNEVRRDAGMPQLELAAGESEKAARLAPHYFAAQAGLEEELVADKVVLGLRAGWSVDGKVRFGDFTASVVADLDVSALVGAALASPSGRETLLNPAVRKMAVGPVIAREEKLLAAVMSTYAFADGIEGQAEKLLERVAEARRRAGRAAPVLMKEMAGLAATAARAVEKGERGPAGALNAAMEEAASATQKPVRGWWVEYSTLDELKIPDELVKPAGLRLAIAVAQHRPDGEPWTRYVALVIIADDGGTYAMR